MSGPVVSLRWDVPPGVLAKKVGDYGERLTRAVFDLATFFAAKIEASAKANASWTDRTGNARQGLTGRAIATATGVVIYLFGTMDYQIWLEVSHAGRFAVILRTLESFYGPFMAALRRLIGA